MRSFILFNVLALEAFGLTVYKDSEVKTLDWLETKAQICATAVGFDTGKENYWCREQCDNFFQKHPDAELKAFLESTLTFAEACYFQHYERPAPGGDGASTLDLCYTDVSTFRPDHTTYLTLLGSNIETPAICQGLCQARDKHDCMRFQWHEESKDCYAFSLRQGIVFSLDRTAIRDDPTLGDDLCAASPLDCEYLKCFSFWTNSFYRFPGEIIGGWRWCHPEQTPCLATFQPKRNRYIDYCDGEGDMIN